MGFSIINDNVSHCFSANGSAFISRGGMASCFFLAWRSVGDGLEQLLEKVGTWASCTLISSFLPTSASINGFALREVAPIHFCRFPEEHHPINASIAWATQTAILMSSFLNGLIGFSAVTLLTRKRSRHFITRVGGRQIGFLEAGMEV